uniref:Polyprotein, putative n=1 Tax=Solanum demissum TaxID=50514 RepID=Q0KII1_SOLDE|nr:Polyprotein, putative [Solanum demissum]
MARELSASHGVEIASVFYSDYHKKPLVYPNHVVAIKTFEKFRKLSMQEKFKTMVTQLEVIQQLKTEKLEELQKLREKNERKELTIKLDKMKIEDFSVDMINLEDLNDWIYVMREYLKEIKEIMKARVDKEDFEMTNHNVTVAVAAPIRTVVPPAEKPRKFSCTFTNEVTPMPVAEMPDREKFMIIKAWKQADFLCKGYILNVLEHDLYNVYSAMTTSKELWDALEKKYKTEDACLKKFVVAKFLDYKMLDSKTVGSQVQELQLSFHDLIADDMVVNEAFQMAAMIEKLPSSCNDFKNYLKHKRKEMKLEDLVIRLKIEEDNKPPKRSLIRKLLPKARRERSLTDISENRPRRNSRAIVTTVDKDKDKGKSQANIMKEMENADDLCAIISECNLVENLKEWFLDSGVTRHICSAKEAFATYSPAEFDEDLFLGNTTTTRIVGTGKVMLKKTSGKVLILNNVLHVSTIRKNLVYVALLVKNGFNKDETIDAFKQYKNEVEKQLNLKIKMIRSDRDGEYESPFAEICLEYVKWFGKKEQQNIKGNDECLDNQFWFTKKSMRGRHPYS